MNILAGKKKFNLDTILLGIIFFSVFGAVLFYYSINFSSLIITLLLVIYVNVKRAEGLPAPIDLYLLAALVIIISLFVVIRLRIPAYGIPAISFIMLITLLFNHLEVSFFFSLFIAFLGASIQGANFNVAASLFTSSLVAAMLSYRVRRRSQLLRAGLLAGFFQFLVTIIIEKQEVFLIFTHADFAFLKLCLLNGTLAYIAVFLFLPVGEYVFRTITDISLLELSDFNRPLIRRLILEAPGTYQHSLVVANLSEAAAEAIGANPLLARVGAYYHDIGKCFKPEYFIENQISYRDVHKDLKPSISKLIIVNHVKEGLELAKKHRLNPRIIDFVSQHHGRSLVYYFYQKALELEAETEPKEEEYRYPGPKPQSKETAIVAIADTVEALSRLLDEPTPARIEEMVREAVKKKFMEGELDESELALKDLDKITQSFTRILNATFHTRIYYPKDEHRNHKQAKDKEG